MKIYSTVLKMVQNCILSLDLQNGLYALNLIPFCNPESVIWLILVMIGRKWNKTYHSLTRDNFAPNLQHPVKFDLYLWRTGLNIVTISFIYVICNEYSDIVIYNLHFSTFNPIIILYYNPYINSSIIWASSSAREYHAFIQSVLL